MYSPRRRGKISPARGEVPEWLNGAVSKTVERASVPRVRIPLSPPFFISRHSLRSGLRWGALTGRRAVALANPLGSKRRSGWSGDLVFLLRYRLAPPGASAPRPRRLGAQHRNSRERENQAFPSKAGMVSKARISGRLRGRFFPRKSRRRRPACGQNGHRPPSVRRSGGTGQGVRGCRAG